MNHTTARSVPAPNYTQTPNFFFDQIMPYVSSAAELKVTLAIIRQTFGFHKDEDKLSLSRLEALTGLSRQSVAEGVKLALKRGYVGRRKSGQGFIYGLRVGSQDSGPPANGTSQETRLVTSQESIPTKESKKESVVDSNESTSGIAKDADSAVGVIGIEKHITDRLYTSLDKAGYTLDNSDYGYHLGRAKTMLERMNPSDDELEWLPAQAVAHFEIHSKTDAMSALRYMRQQKARRERLAADRDAPERPSYYDQQTTSASLDKPRAAAWYASVYPVEFGTVCEWIEAGCTHSEIEKRLESGAVA